MSGRGGNFGPIDREAADTAAAALSEILNGVITGEGPTARGRVHFSRTLDREDAMQCERILLAAGPQAVSRAEAEVLLKIDAAATERTDQGCFDDLITKAIAHYALAAAGRDVPPRHIALAADTPLAAWASRPPGAKFDVEFQNWIAAHANGRKHLSAALATIIALFCGAAASPVAESISNLLDLGV